MSAIALKINSGIAAGLICAATTLSPVTTANADTTIATAGTLGSQVGNALCEPTATTSCEPIGLPTAAAVAAADPTFPDSLIQNDFWWLGRANPNAPPRSEILVFTPLSLVPGFLKPAFSWFTQKWDVEICIFGLTATLGPYATTTLSVGRGCN
jgi:hypothetical protein